MFFFRHFLIAGEEVQFSTLISTAIWPLKSDVRSVVYVAPKINYTGNFQYTVTCNNAVETGENRN